MKAPFILCSQCYGGLCDGIVAHFPGDAAHAFTEVETDTVLTVLPSKFKEKRRASTVIARSRPSSSDDTSCTETAQCFGQPESPKITHWSRLQEEEDQGPLLNERDRTASSQNMVQIEEDEIAEDGMHLDLMRLEMQTATAEHVNAAMEGLSRARQSAGMAAGVAKMEQTREDGGGDSSRREDSGFGAPPPPPSTSHSPSRFVPAIPTPADISLALQIQQISPLNANDDEDTESRVSSSEALVLVVKDEAREISQFSECFTNILKTSPKNILGSLPEGNTDCDVRQSAQEWAGGGVGERSEESAEEEGPGEEGGEGAEEWGCSQNSNCFRLRTDDKLSDITQLPENEVQRERARLIAELLVVSEELQHVQECKERLEQVDSTHSSFTQATTDAAHSSESSSQERVNTADALRRRSVRLHIEQQSLSILLRQLPDFSKDELRSEASKTPLTPAPGASQIPSFCVLCKECFSGKPYFPMLEGPICGECKIKNQPSCQECKELLSGAFYKRGEASFCTKCFPAVRAAQASPQTAVSASAQGTTVVEHQDEDMLSGLTDAHFIPIVVPVAICVKDSEGAEEQQGPVIWSEVRVESKKGGEGAEEKGMEVTLGHVQLQSKDGIAETRDREDDDLKVALLPVTSVSLKP